MVIDKLKLPGLVLSLVFMLGVAHAQPQLSGPLTGPLGPGTYLVVGDISIASTATVTVAPGTILLHTGAFTWSINGTLIANGTATDSILFKMQSPATQTHWGGLRFTPTIPRQNSLDYCVIEDAYHSTSPEVNGSGIYIMGNFLHLNHSRISRCQNGHDGAGIYAYYATLMVIENSVIDSCTADQGGGMFLTTCNGAQIKNCIISRNRSTGT
jgi:hypothetical protein